MNDVVSLKIEHSRRIQLALQQHGQAVVERIVVRAEGELPEGPLEVRIWLDPEVGEEAVARVDGLPVGAVAVLEGATVQPRLSAERLVNQTEREMGTLAVDVVVGEEVLGRYRGEVEILAYNEWPGMASPPETLAGFVTPNHPAIGRWLELVRAELRDAGEPTQLEGYQAREPKRVALLAAAVYRAIKRAGIGYASPPASFEERGQKIRTADQVLQEKLATCLDLSVLMAAALEQIGLHALLLLQKDHAYVGVWLTDWHLPESFVDDPLLLQKRVKLGECLVFDSSAAAEGLDFGAACKVGERFLGHVENFRFALDLASARKRKFHPLRLQREALYAPVDGKSEEEQGEQSGQGATIPELPLSRAEAPESPSTRVDAWRRRLLDLSLRNRLLNYKDSKTSLPLVGARPGEIEDVLEEAKRLELVARAESLKAMEGEERAEEVTRYLERGRLLVDLGSAEFEKRVIEIYRRNRQVEHESGASALFLALGMLRWFEAPASETARLAPVLLIPVTIERESVSGPFRIARNEQEPLLNVTLAEKMEIDFGLKLPRYRELPEDESGIDIDGILRSVLERVKDVERFDVVWEACVGIFEFQKFMMWLDLTENAEKLKESAVARQILEGAEASEEAFGAGSVFPRPEELDKTRAAREDLSVVDADSSQLAAVFAAIDGESFVLQGPPGTGKSQTITNMIAQLLGREKTVLFVSEKKAALEVVESRLREVGLGPFTLEVHSDRASRAEIVRQLEEPLKYAWERGPAEWERHAERLEAERGELNAYAEAMHEPGPFLESPYQALSRAVKFQDAPQVRLGLEQAPDEEEYLGMLRAVEGLAETTKRVGPPVESAFRGSRRGEWSPEMNREGEKLFGAAARAGKELFLALQEAVEVVLPSAPEAARSEVMLEVLAALEVSPSPSEELLTGAHGELKAMVDEALPELRRRWQADARVQGCFLPVVYEEVRGEEELIRFRKWTGAFALLSWVMLFFARRRLKKWAPEGRLKSNEEVVMALEQVREVRQVEAALGEAGSRYSQVFRHHWKGAETSPEELEALWAWVETYRRLLLEVEERWGRDAAQRLRELAVNAQERMGEGTSLLRVVKRVSEGRRQWDQSWAQASGFLAFEDRGESLAGKVERAEGWAAGSDLLRDWTDWRRAADHVEERGLGELVEALQEGEVGAEVLVAAFHRSLRIWWLDQVFSTHRVLAEFRGARHDQLVRRFRELDRVARELARREVQARLAARLPDRRAPGEMEILRGEFKKKRSHKPLRRLFKEAPEAVRRLKPCVLMSPLSVARYLDAGMRQFDVVIFDEASQIPPWDAIGAIARADQAIIVGDSRQLPPTNFFSTRVDEEMEEEDLVEFESILDQAVVSGVAEMSLDWHYRSRHESLIAFSNHHYYDNRLHIFPSPEQAVAHLGVRWVEVNGYYDRGGSRTNRAEGEAVVEELVAHLRDPRRSRKSVGVVTFSMAQQRLIEDLVDKARREFPEIERFFGDVAEGVFIKNLENVQGDERDVMLFSIGYGPDQAGKVAMNFGPLNRQGGERRLNVAVTRARELLVLFSTLRADQIDLSRTAALGVRHLKNFLEYAERGAEALVGAVTGASQGAYDSPFERQVAQALRAAGWTVHTQVGVAGYRIDLGVVDPQRPGAYLLGVECDGASYHSSKNARDRDRIRQNVLERLGWKLHRIWSTEWWHSRKREVERLLTLLRELDRKPRPESDATLVASEEARGQKEEPGVLPPSLEEKSEVGSERPMAVPEGSQPWRAVVIEEEVAKDPKRLAQKVSQLLRDVGPLHFEAVGRAIAEGQGMSRFTKKVRGEMRGVLRSMPEVTLRGDEVWPKEGSARTKSVVRYHDEESPSRDIEEVLPVEIENGLRWIVERGLSIEEEEAMRELARLFGYARLGSVIRDRFEDGVEKLVQRGELRREGDRLRRGERARVGEEEGQPS